MAPARSAVATALAALLLGACGGSSGSATRHASPSAAPAARGQSSPSPAAPPAIPTPGPTGVPASSADVSVIKGWSDALRRGDVTGAARFFALPSVLINGVDANGNAAVLEIRTLNQAIAANESLPCGAKLLSADRRGQYVNALFELTRRPGPGGSGCGSGAGQTARTNFVIAGGKIVHWIRAPSDPGDSAGTNGRAV